VDILRLGRSSACLRAEELFEKLLSGEETLDERDALLAHFDVCPRCEKKFGKALRAAEVLHRALAETAVRIPAPSGLTLPPRYTLPGRSPRFIRILVDFSLLLVLGFGLFLLLALGLVTYRSLGRSREKTRVFTAVQEILRLERTAQRILRERGKTELSELVELLRERAAHGGKPDSGSPLVDPWGHRYKFALTEKGLRAWSCGPDGKNQEGRGDDITAATKAPPLGRPRRLPEVPPR